MQNATTHLNREHWTSCSPVAECKQRSAGISQPALMSFSYREAIGILYSGNNFVFEEHRIFSKFSSSILPKRLQSVREVTLSHDHNDAHIESLLRSAYTISLVENLRRLIITFRIHARHIDSVLAHNQRCIELAIREFSRLERKDLRIYLYFDVDYHVGIEDEMRHNPEMLHYDERGRLWLNRQWLLRELILVPATSEARVTDEQHTVSCRENGLAGFLSDRN